jgi:hypothetical protein
LKLTGGISGFLLTAIIIAPKISANEMSILVIYSSVSTLGVHVLLKKRIIAMPWTIVRIDPNKFEPNIIATPAQSEKTDSPL